MKITNRQEKILQVIIREYIKSAIPVGSQFLEENYDFRISPATIRIEMQKLTDGGFLYQPHTSAGRVPTNKGYRFFVDELFQFGSEDKLFFPDLLDHFNKIKRVTDDHFKFIELLTKELASFSSNLALIYLFDRDFLWKDGWKEVFQNPEFKEFDYLENFIKTVEAFEKNIKDIEKLLWRVDNLSKIKVYIGKEKSLLNSKDFSLIVSKSRLPATGKKFVKQGFGEEGFLAIFGPKRMAYDKNIGLINFLTKELEKI